MNHTCIFCNEQLETIRCVGTIKGVSVSLCEEDAKFCENCENITCMFVDESVERS